MVAGEIKLHLKVTLCLPVKIVIMSDQLKGPKQTMLTPPRVIGI